MSLATTESLSGLALPLLTDAACRAADPEIFFATNEVDLAEARTICTTCPSATAHACFAWAIANREQHGLWGNSSPRQRRAATRRKDLR